MSELGNLLQQRRLEKKETLKDVSNQTKIRESFLGLIEEGRFSEMPSYIHAYGFVKNYAEYLGFDYDTEIAHLFAEECPKPATVPVLDESEMANKESDVQPGDYTDNKKKKGGSSLLVFLVIIVILGAGAFFLYKNGVISSDIFGKSISVKSTSGNYINPVVNNDLPVIIEDNETDNITDNVTDNNSVLDQDNQTQAVIDNGSVVSGLPEEANDMYNISLVEPKTVTVRFSDRCWFKYGTDKGVMRELTAVKGTVVEFEFDKNFQISIGNAAAVTLEYNGQKYTNFGRKNAARLNLVYKAVNGSLELQKR